MLQRIFTQSSKKSFLFYTHSKCSSVKEKVLQPLTPRVLSPFAEGIDYDEINKMNSYKIRAFLNEIFDQNLEVGIHLAYQRLIQSICGQDLEYVKQITTPQLGRCLKQSMSSQVTYHESLNNCRDVVFTDLTLKVGLEKMPKQRLSLFDFINIDICDEQSIHSWERTSVENCSVSLECYILSPYSFYDQSQLEDSLYHRIVLETKPLKKLSQPVTIFDLTLSSRRQRRKLLQDYFLGKRYEWRFREIDSFEEH